MNPIITNDWIRGYLAALRTIELAADHIQKKMTMLDEKDEENYVEAGSEFVNLINFIQVQRNEYKMIVDKLNAGKQ